MNKEKWTTENIPDLSGKTIIVTGGNSGLGFESVKAFAEKGAKVILASRSIEKGEAAKQKIISNKIKCQWMNFLYYSRSFRVSVLPTLEKILISLN